MHECDGVLLGGVVLYSELWASRLSGVVRGRLEVGFLGVRYARLAYAFTHLKNL